MQNFLLRDSCSTCSSYCFLYPVTRQHHLKLCANALVFHSGVAGKRNELVDDSTYLWSFPALACDLLILPSTKTLTLVGVLYT